MKSKTGSLKRPIKLIKSSQTVLGEEGVDGSEDTYQIVKTNIKKKIRGYYIQFHVSKFNT